MRIKNLFFLTESDGGLDLQTEISRGIKNFEQTIQHKKELVDEMFEQCQVDGTVIAFDNYYGSVALPDSWENFKRGIAANKLEMVKSINVETATMLTLIYDKILGSNTEYENIIDMSYSFLGLINPRVTINNNGDTSVYQYVIDDQGCIDTIEQNTRAIIRFINDSESDFMNIRHNDLLNADQDSIDKVKSKYMAMYISNYAITLITSLWETSENDK